MGGGALKKDCSADSAESSGRVCSHLTQKKFNKPMGENSRGGGGLEKIYCHDPQRKKILFFFNETTIY